MKILIIGNPNSIWIINFIEYILAEDKRNKIELLCIDEAPYRWNEKYDNLQVRLREFPEHLRQQREKKNKNLLEKIRSISACAKYVRQMGEYDIINVQFVGAVSLLYLYQIRGIKHKLILSYWGSDLLRLAKDNQILEGIFLKCRGCAFITFDNGDLQDVFYRKFRFCRAKNEVAMLSLPVLDWIDKTELEDCRLIGGKTIPENKIVVAVGYNAGLPQQHLKILEQLSKLDHECKAKIVILLQMTYGGTEEYIRICETKCKDAGFCYIVFRDFQMLPEIAQVRRVVDIFVNAQTTDAFSGSLCEYLYAETIVLNAEWLHYRELDEYPFTYREFKEFEELPGLMGLAIKEIEENGHHRKIGKNREIIWRLRSNESCKKQWEKIFGEVIEKAGKDNG